MRFVFHLAPRGTFEALSKEEAEDARYAPPSLATEGFVHLSAREDVAESARLYFDGVEVEVWRVDATRLDVPLVFDDTPRGPMPHAYGSLPREAILEVTTLGALAEES